MNRSPDDERAYLLRRGEDHRRCAAACEDPLQRALHEEFAARYEQRAGAIMVQDD